MSLKQHGRIALYGLRRFIRTLILGKKPMTTIKPSLKAQINQTIIELLLGRIEQSETDAIVNAANSSLLRGGGVDGAIHDAAGSELQAECRKLGGCETGDAKITGGYKLKARYVIHAVGPIYGTRDADKLLASAYRRSIAVALEHDDIHTIAFPAISTGAYLYPAADAATIALTALCDALTEQTQITLAQMVLYEKMPEMYDIFAEILRGIIQRRTDVMLLS